MADDTCWLGHLSLSLFRIKSSLKRDTCVTCGIAGTVVTGGNFIQQFPLPAVKFPLIPACETIPIPARKVH